MGTRVGRMGTRTGRMGARIERMGTRTGRTGTRAERMGARAGDAGAVPGLRARLARALPALPAQREGLARPGGGAQVCPALPSARDELSGRRATAMEPLETNSSCGNGGCSPGTAGQERDKNGTGPGQVRDSAAAPCAPLHPVHPSVYSPGSFPRLWGWLCHCSAWGFFLPFWGFCSFFFF